MSEPFTKNFLYFAADDDGMRNILAAMAPTGHFSVESMDWTASSATVSVQDEKTGEISSHRFEQKECKLRLWHYIGPEEVKS